MVMNRARLEITPSQHGAGNEEAGGVCRAVGFADVSIFTGKAVGKSLQAGAAQNLCPAPLTDQRVPEQRHLYALTC